MMDLVRDVYNKLHTRDDLVFCPSCRRILYIPDDLPPELAIKSRPKPKEKEVAAAPSPPRVNAGDYARKQHPHAHRGRFRSRPERMHRPAVRRRRRIKSSRNKHSISKPSRRTRNLPAPATKATVAPMRRPKQQTAAPVAPTPAPAAGGGA